MGRGAGAGSLSALLGSNESDPLTREKKDERRRVCPTGV